MPDWILRRADLSDADALVRCIDAAYAIYADTIKDLPDVSGGVAGDIEDHIVFVAEQAGRVVAGLVLMLGEDYLKVAILAVHPDAGGRGLGRALMARAESEAASRGLEQLRLATHVAMPGNVRFYSSMGWVEDGRAGNTVMMRKDL